MLVGQSCVTVLVALGYSSLGRGYAVILLGVTMAMAYNVTRFIPRTPSPAEPAVPLTGEDLDAVTEWIAGCTEGWRPTIQVSPWPRIRVDGDLLEVGMPLWAGLREQELVAVIRDAKQLSHAVRTGPVARALRISRGDVGRGLRHRRRGGGWLVRPIDARVAELAVAHRAWVESVRAGRDEEWAAIEESAATVSEGWELLTRSWLAPALRQEAWHGEPFTGLRNFLTACEETGMIERTLPRAPGQAAIDVLRHGDAYERELAEALVAEAPHAEEPIGWEDHPSTVTEHQWRVLLAAGLHAADIATGTPQTARLDTLISLLESGWGDTIAAALASDPAGTLVSEPDATLRDLLEAALSVAFLDAGAATTSWTWPFGTLLLGYDGQAIPVTPVVAEVVTALRSHLGVGDLREWLGSHGIDPAAPLWLDGGVTPQRERPLLAFEAFRGWRTVHVVVSDRALRLFGRRTERATVERVRMHLHGPSSVFGETMDAVAAGDLTAQDLEVPIASVVRATLTPLMGGHWWRLRVRTPDQQLTITGNGSGRDVEAMLSGLLDDRLSTRWLHAPRWARWTRNAFGYAGLSVGGVFIVTAPFVLANPASDLQRSDSAAFVLIGVVAIAVGLVPDLIAVALRWPQRRLQRSSPF